MGPQAKRRKVAAKVDEVNFDPAARHEFLTGFRKRKLQRARHAQEIAEKRAKEDARQDRKRMREERAAEFERAMKEHQEQLKRMNQGSDSEDGSGSQNESDDEDREWGGFEEPPAVDYEAEYVDEDKYTTVTVEEMDPSREGLLKSAKTESDEDEDEDKRTKKEEADHDSTAPTKKRKTKPTDKPKKKTKKFRYESKEDRKLNLLKQRLSNKKKAAARRER